MDASRSASSVGGRALKFPTSLSSFRCGVCLDLLYKPVVLACGHISCFWCIYKAMHGARASNCAICRQQYNYFPSICHLLHHLLRKMEPEAYNLREKEVLEEEKILDRFSPQWVDRAFPEKIHADKNNPPILDETENSVSNLKADHKVFIEGGHLIEDDQMNETCKQVSVSDVQCAGCKELLFQPSVLNCGHGELLSPEPLIVCTYVVGHRGFLCAHSHRGFQDLMVFSSYTVFCHSCMAGIANGPPKCQVCRSVHPGQFPKVCLQLDHFLKELFPKEYAIRQEKVWSNNLDEKSLNSAFETQNPNAKPCHSKDDKLQINNADFSKAHVGVGCDSCGMYPIVGERYKCKDCKEKVGFDLCGACYSSNSTLPGRFNQQHRPEHRLESDDSRMLCKIWMLEILQPEVPPVDLVGGPLEDH